MVEAYKSGTSQRCFLHIYNSRNLHSMFYKSSATSKINFASSEVCVDSFEILNYLSGEENLYKILS